MYNVWGRGAEFWWGDLRERDRLQDLGVNVRIINLRQSIPVAFFLLIK
jgi:hypothetical protein